MNKTLNFSLIETATSELPQPIEFLSNNKAYIVFGDDNNYPNTLFNYYNDCTVLQSAINTLYDYISGNGFTESEIEDIEVNKKGLTLYQLMRMITLDYCIFGAFAINVLRDSYGTISELYYMDVRSIRLGEKDEEIFFKNKWSRYTKSTKKYKRFVKDSKDTNSIFYYANPTSRGVYGIPFWSSAIRDIQTQIEISKFHLNNILNNFVPSGMISFNNGTPDEETQKEIENKINEKFSGSNNAGRLLVTFSDSAEQAPTFNRMADDNYDEKYAQLYTTTLNNILAAFRCSAQLLGITTQQTGFSDIEYQNAFSIYKTLVVSPLQREIEKAFSKLGYKYNPKFKEFVVTFNNEERI